MVKYKEIISSGKKYLLPEFTELDYWVLYPSGNSTNVKVDGLYNTVYDQKNFNTSRSPYFIHTIKNKIKFSRPNNINVLDMPIKFPNSDQYRVPLELQQFIEPIQTIIDNEHQLNSNVNDYHAYLTINQSIVEPNRTQRDPGWHVDGLQGSRINPKTLIHHSYLVSDSCPILYSLQPFDVSGLDEGKHNYFEAFQKQVKENTIRQAKNYDILLTDAYMFHAAASSDKVCHRTFFRLAFDVRPFDRIGNSINPLFDYKWNYVSREIDRKLI